LSLKIKWIGQNYVSKNISIIQDTKSPFIFFPLVVFLTQFLILPIISDD